NGVYFDFSKNVAKLTFSLLRLVYAWMDESLASEERYSDMLSIFGPIMLPQQQGEGASVMDVDVVERAVNASGLTKETVTLPESSPTSPKTEADRKNFLNVLHKLRSVGGIEKKMKKIRRQPGLSGSFIAWCEEEGKRYMDVLVEKERQKEKERNDLMKKMMKPVLQRQEGGYFRNEETQLESQSIFSDDEDEAEEEESSSGMES
ncbi:MAG: hypothetical protein AAGK05_19140, partial [Pseudomonadota bacterium]